MAVAGYGCAATARATARPQRGRSASEGRLARTLARMGVRKTKNE
jgi:hypothetical protein